jgi:hypothetical protein
MEELIEQRFERHPVMAPTFNGFLFSERASHSDIKHLEIKIGEMSNLTRTLQSKVDKSERCRAPAVKKARQLKSRNETHPIMYHWRMFKSLFEIVLLGWSRKDG